ncbi:hypothetical protein [Novosphingobium sp. 9]|uniref:hypothetical protein n=1 Tax=Novosphingobium sp. 9 TaxID=2025349 RepID=UPI0021B6B084|nr:hypothetical protein [Novosphingobium sp. 9]
MAFQFTRIDEPDVAKVVYSLPDLPEGVSTALLVAVTTYTAAVKSGPDALVDATFAALQAWNPRNTADLIAKTIYSLHRQCCGLTEDGRLVIPSGTPDQGRQIKFIESMLGVMHEQIASVGVPPAPDATMLARLTSIAEFAIEAQSRCTRIIEMSRVIDEVSEDLPPDCEAARVRICSEVIDETAEAMRDQLEAVERTCNDIRRALQSEAA